VSVDRPRDVRAPRPAILIACGLALLALAWTAPSAHAGAFTGMRGHLGIGYAKLLTADGPAGSMSGAVGLDLPVRPTVRAGIEIGASLLGTRTVEDSAQIAELDYNLLEMLAMVHWRPAGWGPIGRVSFGGGLFGPRIDQSSAAPASFESYTLRGARAGLAAGLSFMPHDERPLAAGIEIGARWVFVPGDDWLVSHVRFVVHY
jgi:hypothetical protein